MGTPRLAIIVSNPARVVSCTPSAASAFPFCVTME
jgi:hypothetical protein